MRSHANFSPWQFGRPLTAEENRALARRYRDGDEAERAAVREAMIVGNQALVKTEALKFRRSRLDFADRMQEGNFGLMRAIDAYDPEWAKFSTYASKKIYAAIQKADRCRSHVIHIPVWVQEGRRDDRPEHAAAGMLARCMWSLDLPMPGGEPLGGIGGDPLRDSIVAPEVEGQDLGEREDIVAKAIGRLPLRAQTVIKMRYGFGCDPCGMRETGQAIGGVSRQRVDQLQRKAESLLREMPELMEVVS